VSVQEEERPYSTNPGYEEPIYCRPPVPQRCGSLDRNIVDQIINPIFLSPSPVPPVPLYLYLKEN